MNDPRHPIDLSTVCAGIKAPNPFWLASAPPTNTADQVMRAFELGWGGAVWKTVSLDPVINVTSRYGAIDIANAKMAGFSNIELISDRSLSINLREIKAVKKRYPKNALIVSVMAPCDRGRWHELVSRVCDTGCDGIELNLGCPHGMSERGMGSAIGQVPEYVRLVTEFAKERSTVPVLVKLTPNITDMRHTARSAKEGQADGLSLINTVNSLMGVDVESLTPKFSVGGKISHGGYSGPAIKPIALHHLSQISTDPQMNNIPLSGIGGISSWSDAVEFMLLGASSVQLCTVVMHHGFPIISDLLAGLNGWMRRKKFNKLSDFIGLSSHHVVGWNSLNLHHKTLATIDSNKCIGCGVCVSSCQDGAHQAIGLNTSGGNRIPHIIDENCVGCNLCALACPVDGCITMINVPTGHSELTWEDYAHNELTGYKEVYKRN